MSTSQYRWCVVDNNKNKNKIGRWIWRLCQEGRKFCDFWSGNVFKCLCVRVKTQVPGEIHGILRRKQPLKLRPRKKKLNTTCCTALWMPPCRVGSFTHMTLRRFSDPQTKHVKSTIVNCAKIVSSSWRSASWFSSLNNFFVTMGFSHHLSPTWSYGDSTTRKRKKRAKTC